MANRPSVKKGSEKRYKDFLKIFGPAILITLMGFIVAYQFVDPAPPKRISMATGSETGAYYPFGLRYREVLARYGIALEVRATAGSVENIRLLKATEGAVDVAFVQGGTGRLEGSEELASLASLYFEPLWVFHRTNISPKVLTDLRGKRIAVGPEGSGTRAIAMRLLSDNAITSKETTLLPLGGNDAVEALGLGKIDAAFLVASSQASVVQTLLKSKGIALMSFERAEAYSRVHRFLSMVKLPEGVVDFQANTPPRDTLLLAPAATLVAKKDLHPALIDLLLIAATEVHSGGGIFEEPNEFPSGKYLDFPLHKEARRHLKSGPPFLMRYLPFWAATLIDRLKVMLLPLLTLLIPFFKIVPPGYRWRVRYKIFRWYRELQAVDLTASEDESDEALNAHIAELHRIENEVMQVTVPLPYAQELYALRLHIAYVLNRLLSYKTSREGRLSHQPVGSS